MDYPIIWDEVLTEEEILTHEEIAEETKTAKNRYLIVHNDDINTFDWVIESLCEICGHDEIQAEQCALIIHNNGKAVVKSGMRDKLNPMRIGLTDRGIDATMEWPPGPLRIFLP